MSPAPEPPKERTENKSRIYFIIGGCLLLAMGLLSAVDSSIVAMLLGGSVFFFFLGFYHSPRFKRNTRNTTDPYASYSNQSQRRQQQDRSPENNFTLRDLWNQFKDSKIKFPAGDSTQAKSRRAIKIFLVIFVAMFAIPILVSLFNGNDSGQYASAYYEIGEQQYNAGQLDSAYHYYKLALADDPEYENALVGYGKVLRAREQKDSAAIIFDKVLEINADNREATFFKAYGYYDQARYSDGVALLQPFLDDNDDYYDGMLLLGDFYYAMKQHDDALKWYDKAYQEGGARNVNLCYYMASIYDEQANYEKAIPLYQETLSYDSTLVDVYQRLGELVKDAGGNYYRTKASQLRR